ncbi:MULTISPECIES: tyrosine-protein kinase family protein [Actibacterium]|uniref:Mrp family chromosome partitioning ATPase n=1 Tax=Actibacterium naphthalenivorans TaxID=1614693 RepID=A0A840CE00_9RHOB|nr:MULTISPECIES: CpsD/CapB family tyrosine-protein kinase [Actibacterium]MBB4021519.1 Mrp family chromosome partitioning ATPase [Actibacterium naphthalenivorans]
MEKLQAALEQARRQRTEGASERGPAKAALVRPLQQNVVEAWDALQPLNADPKLLQRNRVYTSLGNAYATPYDMLRTKMFQLMNANGWRRVAITSPSPGSGKTTTTANLASSFGRQVDLRSVVMDMDMRRPSLARVFGHSGTYSVFDVLEETVPFAEQALRFGKNVALSMNTKTARDPSELFLRRRTAEIIDEIENTYQPGIMLFDMPPVLSNDDTRAFLDNVDCALIVAEAEQSTIKQIDLCERELAEQTNVLGVVLNKCRFSDDSYGYGYGLN